MKCEFIRLKQNSARFFTTDFALGVLLSFFRARARERARARFLKTNTDA